MINPEHTKVPELTKVKLNQENGTTEHNTGATAFYTMYHHALQLATSKRMIKYDKKNDQYMICSICIFLIKHLISRIAIRTTLPGTRSVQTS